jgi:hypothetical protein
LNPGDALCRKLAVARAERDQQVAAFKEVSRTVEKDLQQEWQHLIDAWLKDPTQQNQYTVEKKGTSRIYVSRAPRSNAKG